MKRRITIIIAAVALVLALAGPAAAITKGQPDGDNHPAVALLYDGAFVCTGTLISPTVALTAAHCFSHDAGPNDGKQVFASFAPDTFAFDYAGSYYWNPDWCNVCGNGLVGFDAHDIGLVIFDQPIPESVVPASEYGQLPEIGYVDTLANNTRIDSVGFFDQYFVVGSGACDIDPAPGCQPQPGDAFTRHFVQTRLVPGGGALGSEFIKLSAAKGGTCFGDSGGPNFVAGTNLIVGVNSFVTNGRCNGVTYSNRIDTVENMTWIRETIATYG